MSGAPGFSQAQYDRAQRESLYAFAIAAFNVLHGNRVFRRAIHIEAMCFALERVARGELKRLIITVPPRHLKSITVAVAFVAWMLGRDPSKRMWVASYGADLAAKHSRDFRRVTQDPGYRRAFPAYQVSEFRDTMQEVETTQGGGRKGVSLGGAATGFGADYIIIDDIAKAADAYSLAAREQAKVFVDETLTPRFNDPATGVMIVIQQRLHEDDIVGHLLDKGGWEHINLPAIAQERQLLPLYEGRLWTREPGDLLAPNLMKQADLDQKRIEMGSRAFEAQYQQNPMPPDGDRVDWSWFNVYEYPLAQHEYEYIVQSWDTATSADPGSDFSVCMTFGCDKGCWDLLDIYRARLNYPDLRRAAKRLYREWQPERVLVEYASSGRQLVQDLHEDLPNSGRRDFIPVGALANKEERLALQSAKIEQGMISLPAEAPWLGEFRRELLVFPGGRHDDQVDCLTQFLQWIGSQRGTRFLCPRNPHTGRPLGTGPRPRGTDYSRLSN